MNVSLLLSESPFFIRRYPNVLFKTYPIFTYIGPEHFCFVFFFSGSLVHTRIFLALNVFPAHLALDALSVACMKNHTRTFLPTYTTTASIRCNAIDEKEKYSAIPADYVRSSLWLCIWSRNLRNADCQFIRKTSALWDLFYSSAMFSPCILALVFFH